MKNPTMNNPQPPFPGLSDVSPTKDLMAKFTKYKALGFPQFPWRGYKYLSNLRVIFMLQILNETKKKIKKTFYCFFP